jgi:hypothetical protein
VVPESRIHGGSVAREARRPGGEAAKGAGVYTALPPVDILETLVRTRRRWLTLAAALRILAGPLMTSACDCFWSEFRQERSRT